MLTPLAVVQDIATSACSIAERLSPKVGQSSAKVGRIEKAAASSVPYTPSVIAFLLRVSILHRRMRLLDLITGPANLAGAYLLQRLSM